MTKAELARMGDLLDQNRALEAQLVEAREISQKYEDRYFESKTAFEMQLAAHKDECNQLRAQLAQRDARIRVLWNGVFDFVAAVDKGDSPSVGRLRHVLKLAADAKEGEGK